LQRGRTMPRAAPFPSLLNKIHPRRAVVLGKELWSNMPETFLTITDDVQAYRLSNNELCVCWAVNHPSRGLSWRELATIIYFACGNVLRANEPWRVSRKTSAKSLLTGQLIEFTSSEVFQGSLPKTVHEIESKIQHARVATAATGIAFHSQVGVRGWAISSSGRTGVKMCLSAADIPNTTFARTSMRLMFESCNERPGCDVQWGGYRFQSSAGCENPPASTG
jgi:hypothetical protein